MHMAKKTINLTYKVKINIESHKIFSSSSELIQIPWIYITLSHFALDDPVVTDLTMTAH